MKKTVPIIAAGYRYAWSSLLRARVQIPQSGMMPESIVRNRRSRGSQILHAVVMEK